MSEPEPHANDEMTVEQLQEKLTKEISNSQRTRKRAQDAEARIAELEGKVMSDDDREQLKTLREAAAKAEQEKLTKKGDYDKLLEAEKQRFQQQLDGRDGQVKGLTELVQQIAGRDRIKSALAASGVKFVDAAASLLASRVKVVLKDGKPMVLVVDETGNPVINPEGAAGETISVEAMVKNYLASDEGQIWTPPSGAGGSGRHSAGSSGLTGSDLLASLDADPQKKAEYIEKHGASAFQKLAHSVRQK